MDGRLYIWLMRQMKIVRGGYMGVILVDDSWIELGNMGDDMN